MPVFLHLPDLGRPLRHRRNGSRALFGRVCGSSDIAPALIGDRSRHAGRTCPPQKLTPLSMEGSIVAGGSPEELPGRLDAVV